MADIPVLHGGWRAGRAWFAAHRKTLLRHHEPEEDVITDDDLDEDDWADAMPKQCPDKQSDRHTDRRTDARTDSAGRHHARPGPACPAILPYTRGPNRIYT